MTRSKDPSQSRPRARTPYHALPLREWAALGAFVIVSGILLLGWGVPDARA